MTTLLAGVALGGALARTTGPWVADRGDGTYRNPILYADYSDPDAVRVGDDFYMTSSSFTAAPGLPILHSRDLVNWRLVNHALPRLVPEGVFAAPQHGNGVWAPALRHHAGRFWIFYGDPDHGIYVTTAVDPAGDWSRPVLVKPGNGLIDPCPFWDDDGSVYLMHAWARSRAGFNNVLTLHRLNGDATRVVDEGRIVINGNDLAGYTTLEGPKLYKRGEWYYVFAPAGGVKQGWQSVFRAKSLDGPFEDRIVLAQGSTSINGPHQGALVDTPTGDSWFLHFQDLDAYGRVVHLQPVVWREGWPVIGNDEDGDGKGEPVDTWRKPNVGRTLPPQVPQTSDEFNERRLGLQWQWQANPGRAWSSLDARPGMLRLASMPAAGPNLWGAPHLLLQKLPAPRFTATASVELRAAVDGERAGVIVFGADYAWVGLHKSGDRLRLVVSASEDAASGAPERELAAVERASLQVYLRVSVDAGATYGFSYSLDNQSFTAIGGQLTAKPGRWVGAKVGLFSAAPAGATTRGYADVDWFRIE